MLLKQGSVGPEVVELQRRLKELNLYTGNLDGDFGPGTRIAVVAFQQKVGLIPDGLAGPQTLAALTTTAVANFSNPASLFTVDVVAKIFFDAPRRNVEQHLSVVLEALQLLQLGDRPMVLMALATIRAETAGFEPLSEFRSRFNTSPNGTPFDLYDFRTDIGNNGKGHGALYRGRGFVQLTGLANYRKFGPIVKEDLVNHPDRANDPDVAAKLLAYFLKDKEYLVRQDLARSDLRAARRRVNGGSHGLAQFEQAYKTGWILTA